MDMTYHAVQAIAKETMAYAERYITPGMRLPELRALCEAKLLELGADSFWYWDVGAFVFSGDETALSVSGRAYRTSDRVIEPNDIITIDLSPQVGSIWGDYARTILLENGVVIVPVQCANVEWRNGLQMEKRLHDELQMFAKPQTTFEELYFHMNQFIVQRDYINLDFAGNLGHSIVRQKDDRIYIEKGNNARLGDVAYFTFEPHIGVKNSPFGYKQENIYYFDNGELVEL